MVFESVYIVVGVRSINSLGCRVILKKILGNRIL